MKSTNIRPYKVFAIKAGTVIDHITAGHALKIVRLLNLADENRVVTIGLNFSSKKMKLKDIIKVENRELTKEEINRVAIFAPLASINIIKDFAVIKKFRAEIPETIEYVVTCPNPKCLTNHESITTKFHVLPKSNNIHLKCHYCEKVFLESEINEYKNA